nr:orf230 [Zancudomyces culisetae]AAW49488.1 orf230 [Zancudomyces culisetae]
ENLPQMAENLYKFSGEYMIYSLQFIIPSIRRVGPHNIDLLSILIGSLLGDSYLERHGKGSRFCFQQEHTNSSYLLWLHNELSLRGYCNQKIPEIKSRIGKKNTIRYVIRFKTWTYTSFNYFQDNFYKNNKKIIPFEIIEQYLTPLALTIWIMDDGCRSGKGLKISTNSFTYKEVEFLANILKKKYCLTISIHKTGSIDQYCLYIHKKCISELFKIVSPWLHPSMKYKFIL